jgi:hypothetical protein
MNKFQSTEHRNHQLFMKYKDQVTTERQALRLKKVKDEGISRSAKLALERMRSGACQKLYKDR